MSESDDGNPGSQQSWILGLASVVFDIDQGQTLECLYPEGILSDEESRDVAFNSKSLLWPGEHWALHIMCGMEYLAPFALLWVF